MPTRYQWISPSRCISERLQIEGLVRVVSGGSAFEFLFRNMLLIDLQSSTRVDTNERGPEYPTYPLQAVPSLALLRVPLYRVDGCLAPSLVGRCAPSSQCHIEASANRASR